MAYIYKITNNINSKVYIGQTIKSVSERFSQHQYTARKIIENPKLPQENRRFNMPIARAMAKHGIDNFFIEVVEECSLEQLDEKEIYWIHFFHSYDPQFGYNATLGGQLTRENVHISEANDIIKAFNEGKSIRELKEIFHHKDATILTLLRYYGAINDQTQLTNGRYISLPLQQLVIDLYKESHSIQSVADKTIFGVDMIKSILQSNGIAINRYLQIAQYDMNDNLIHVYNSQSEAGRMMAEQYHCSAKGAANHISECCRDKRKTAVGFKWSFY